MASKKKADDSQPTQPRAGKARSRAAGSREGGKPARAGDPATVTATSPVPMQTSTGKVVVERQIGGRTLTLETGRMAKLSDGACVARYGDTMVLATVNG